MSLQNNELENNRDANSRVGASIVAPSSSSPSTTIETANLHKSNDDKTTIHNHKSERLTDVKKSSAIESTQAKCEIDMSGASGSTNDDANRPFNVTDTVIQTITTATTTDDGNVVATECSACDSNKTHVKCDDDSAIDDSETSSSSNSPIGGDTVFKAHLSKPSLGNLQHTTANQTRKLNAPPTIVPLSSPPNVPMFVNRFPNTHPTYLPPHIRNLPKTQSLDLPDNEMPTGLLATKQSSFEQNRPIYPNVPYSPYGSPFGSPRNRRRGPLRESRRISIEKSGSFLQLNQYKLMDQIGQVSGFLFSIFYRSPNIFAEPTHFKLS